MPEGQILSINAQGRAAFQPAGSFLAARNGFFFARSIAGFADVNTNLNDLIPIHLPFRDVNWRQSTFKIFLTVKLLSTTSAAGVGYAEPPGLRFVYQSHAAHQFFPGDIREFSGQQTDFSFQDDDQVDFVNTDFGPGPDLSFPATSGDTYIYEREHRQKWNFPTNFNIFSRTHREFVTAGPTGIATPNFGVSPWIFDGFFNTYGAGVFLFINSANQLIMRDKAQQNGHRNVWLLGVQFSNIVI